MCLKTRTSLYTTEHTVYNRTHCVQPNTLYTTEHTVYNQTHCIQPNTLYTTKHTVYNQTHCIQPNTLYTTKQTVHNQTHCTQPNTLYTTNIKAVKRLAGTVQFAQNCIIQKLCILSNVFAKYMTRFVLAMQTHSNFPEEQICI